MVEAINVANEKEGVVEIYLTVLTTMSQSFLIPLKGQIME